MKHEVKGKTNVMFGRLANVATVSFAFSDEYEAMLFIDALGLMAKSGRIEIAFNAENVRCAQTD